jgi:glycosyltransferase involved in cell wall biosynthesis
MADVTSRRAKGSLRVALLTATAYPFTIGGKEERHRQLARHLHYAGVDVTIYTMRAWGTTPRIVVDDIPHVGIAKYRPVYDGSAPSLAQAFYFTVATLRMLTMPFDVLDVDSIPITSVLPARLITWLRRRPITVTCYEVFTTQRLVSYYGRLRGRIGMAIQRRALRTSAAFVAPSTGTARRIEAIRGRADVVTIPLGVDCDQLRRVPALVGPAPDLLCIGRLVADKRTDLAVRALRFMHDTGQKASMLVLGSGPERANLEQLVDRLGLRTAVTLEDPWMDKARMIAMLKAARVLVAPSSKEGFGLTVLEAMTVDTPIVMANDDDNLAVELISAARRVAVVPPSPPAFAEAIAAWMREGNAPRRPVASGRDWHDYAADTLSHYRVLVERTRRSE